MGLAAGSAIAWWRARLIEVSVDPEAGRLNQWSSAGAPIVLGAIMLVRWLLHWAVMWSASRWHFGAMLISDIFTALAIGVLTAFRVELFMHAKRLLRSG